MRATKENSIVAFPTGCTVPGDKNYSPATSAITRKKPCPRKGYIAPVEEISERRKSDFMAAIQTWTRDMRSAQVSGKDELSDIQGFERLIVLRNSLLANMIGICRDNPRQDCRMVVLTMIVFFSDNPDFVCHLSIKRMAQIIVRKEETIRDAILYLEEHGAIDVKRSRGLLSVYSPSVPLGLDEVTASVAWFADALSQKPEPHGRPPKRPQTTTKVAKKPPTKVEKTPPLEPENPPARARQYITKLNHSELTVSISGESESLYIRTREKNRPSVEFAGRFNYA